ncbi:MAG: lytic transglycosylase domain-containing protein [Deltaproteobacteria bacterium]|jgi:soluble lytic murein transglycosylase-like protein|nr:lytic transglycosylase domain-containing protein [Deltaproteobacteria bacterium]
MLFASIGLLVAALGSEALGPPRPIFFDFPPTPPALVQAYSAPASPSRYGRRKAAYERLVAFIRAEKFDEAGAFIKKQSPELRSWPGIAALEAGLLSSVDPKKSLEIYDKVLKGDRDRYWVRALAGYRSLLGHLSAKGDYLARARLARLLAFEWRNAEAKRLLDETLADVALPAAIRKDLEAFGAVLDLRVGNFTEAENYWANHADIASQRYLATLRSRQGRLAEAADLRLKTADLLKGAAQLKEYGRAFDALVKGGLTERAKKLLDEEPELRKRIPSWSFLLGLSALVAKNPEGAISYFAAEENSPSPQGTRALYFKGRALEMANRFSEASVAYKSAKSRTQSYYQILAAGRYEFLNDAPADRPAPLGILNLIEGYNETSSLGFFLWLSQRLPWPWPDLNDPAPVKVGQGEAARTKAAINHYLSQGDLKEALAELAGGAEALIPKKPAPLTEDMARWILLAAKGGDYRLTIKLLSQVKQNQPYNGSWSRAYSHPLVYGGPIAKAFRSYGVPPALVLALIRVESAFQVEAVSSSNARGLTQLLPSTAQSIANLLGEPEPREEDLFDPALNIRYGTWYLNELRQSFGLWPLALAAYNGGPFNIKSCLDARLGLPLDVFIETLPFPETIRYVQSVLESEFVYKAAYLGINDYPNLTNPLAPALKDPPPF